MNIVTESHIAGRPIGDKPHARPVRTVRWFIVIGLLLVLLVGGLVGFNACPVCGVLGELIMPDILE